jgi:hypothetical protein
LRLGFRRNFLSVLHPITDRKVLRNPNLNEIKSEIPLSSDGIIYIARAVRRQRNLGLFCLMLLKYFYLTSSLNLFMGIRFLCFVRAKVLCRGHSIYVLILSHLKIKNSSHHFSELDITALDTKSTCLLYQESHGLFPYWS